MEKEILDLYFAMQNLNRAAIKYAAGMIQVGMCLPKIKALYEEYLLKNGADSFWYWDVDAFIFSGDETTISVSGKDYKTTDRTIQENDIITINLVLKRITFGEIMREHLYLKMAYYVVKPTKSKTTNSETVCNRRIFA